jgi:chemotaxis protein MotB
VILDQIGPTLNNVDNPISIAGHTDALQYAGGEKGYSNWELSSERANAARRELVNAGMKDTKVMQVRGLAGSVPIDPKNLSNPSNRRISVVVLNNETVERLKQDGTVPPDGAASPAPGAPEGSPENKPGAPSVAPDAKGEAAKPAGGPKPDSAPTK